jgi:hypothetical protein
MRQSDEVAAQRIEEGDIVERVADAHDQRHQHDRADQQHRRQRIQIGLGGEPGTPFAMLAFVGHLPLSCFCFALVKYAAHCLFISAGVS